MKTLYAFLILFVLSIVPAEATPWDRLSPEEHAFCKEHMAKALKLYHAGHQDAALQSMKESYDLADTQFSHSFFFHRIIWFEAQVLTGKSDEAWGLKVFRFLRDREHMYHPQHAVVIPGRDFVLYGNIIEKLGNLGMLAQARMETSELAHTLSEHRGFDLSCNSYPANGTLFGFTGEVRSRTYPIMCGDLEQGKEIAAGHDRLIYYCYMYGVQYVSSVALASGDWTRAAELADWFMQYNDAFAQGTDMMRGEVCRIALLATDMLANICLMHDQPMEAAKLYQAFIDKCRSKYYTTAPYVCDMAWLNLARVQIQLGTLKEDAIEMAGPAVAGIASWHHDDRAELIHATLSKARIFHYFGNKADAWAIIDDLFDETSRDVTPQHQLRILTTAIDLAMDEGGTHPELEKWLVLALDNERQLGNKFKELPLYEKYARFLSIHGRLDEAEAIYNEAIRLAKAMNIPRRIQQNQLALQALQQQRTGQVADHSPLPHAAVPEGAESSPATQTAEHKAETAQDPASSGGSSTAGLPVEIQPRQSLTAALPGYAAHGRFYLTNPAITPQTGQLKIEGRVEQLNWQNDEWLTLQASPEFALTSNSSPLTLQPGESFVIDISGHPAQDEKNETVTCSWMSGGKLVSQGQWDYRSGSSGKRTAVIDAHELQDNPFYLVPINHALQRLHTEKAETVDFTVTATAPMRIEAYNGTTGALLYVDANGDGDFEDSGDLIASDANHNNWPDILFGAGDRMASLTFYVKPEASHTQEQELAIQLMQNGTWRIDAIDVIK